MKYRKTIFSFISIMIFLLMVIPFTGCGALKNAKTAEIIEKGTYTVKIIEFNNLTDSNRNNRNVPIKVHMPTQAGSYPVIIISHGAGGNWDGHYALAQYLASNGYIVLCVEHVGSNTEKITKGMRFKLDVETFNKNLNEMLYNSDEAINRPKDISFAINMIQQWNKTNEVIKQKADLNNIGVLGHSFGAYTTMVICGARPVLDWITPTIAPGKGIGPDLSDSRVKCGIALSPQGVGEPFFSKESFGFLKTPLMGISGTKDQQQGDLPAQNRYDAFDYWPQNNGQNKFVWLNNAKHMDFSDSQGSGATSLPSENRDKVQKVVRAAAISYFNCFLKGDKAALNSITTEALTPYLSGEINSVEVRSK